MTKRNKFPSFVSNSRRSCCCLSWLCLGAELAAYAATPTIEFQPKDQKVILCQPVAFGVIANGAAPLTYQWRRDGVAIPGATNDQIVLPHAQFSDAGKYSVLVSDRDGAVLSQERQLTVNPPRAGDVDFSFDAGSLIDGPIVDLLVQPDGKIVACGGFRTVHGALRSGLARFNADGTTDFTFGDALAGDLPYPYADHLARQADGRLLISTYAGAQPVVTRVNRDGSLDSTFWATFTRSDTGGGAGEPIAFLVPLRDGRVLIGGRFAAVNGVARANLVRLNLDGTLDASFSASHLGFDDRVAAAAEQPDGKLVVGGNFHRLNGLPAGALVRLNPGGSLDDTFTQAAFRYGGVTALALQEDGQILVGGWSTAADGTPRARLLRLNREGILDPGFQAHLSGFDISSIHPLSAGGAVIGVHESGPYGYIHTVLHRINDEGGSDADFDRSLSATSYEINGSAGALEVHDDGTVLLAGEIRTATGEFRRNLARFNPNGELDVTFRNGLAGTIFPVSSISVLRNEDLMVAGGVDDSRHDSIVRLSSEGALLQSFVRLTNGFSSSVGSSALSGDATYTFSEGGRDGNGVLSPRSDYLWRLLPSGQLGRISNFEWHSNPNVGGGAEDSGAQILGVDSSGRTLIGTGPGVVRLASDGTPDPTFVPIGLGSLDPWGEAHAYALALTGDERLILGGVFDQVNQVRRTSVARAQADGTLDLDFNPIVTNANRDDHRAAISTLVVLGDGSVMMGGWFTHVNGEAHTNIVRLDGNGNLDHSFVSPIATTEPGVEMIQPLSDGKMLVAGNLSARVSGYQAELKRLNPDGSVDEAFHAEVNLGGSIRSLVVQRDGRIVMGGYFSTVNGLPQAGIARLWPDSGVPPTITGFERHAHGMVLEWTTIPGRAYRVQSRDGLTGGSWMDLPGEITATGGKAHRTEDAFVPSGQRFYRVLLLGH